MKHSSLVFNSVAAAGILSLAGCASTAPKAHFSQEIVASSHVTSIDDVQVNVGPRQWGHHVARRQESHSRKNQGQD